MHSPFPTGKVSDRYNETRKFHYAEIARLNAEIIRVQGEIRDAFTYGTLASLSFQARAHARVLRDSQS